MQEAARTSPRSGQPVLMGQSPAHDQVCLPMHGRRPLRFTGERMVSVERRTGALVYALHLFLTANEGLLLVLTRQEAGGLPLGLLALPANDSTVLHRQLDAFDPTAFEPVELPLLAASDLPSLLSAQAEQARRMETVHQLLSDLRSSILRKAPVIPIQ